MMTRRRDGTMGNYKTYQQRKRIGTAASTKIRATDRNKRNDHSTAKLAKPLKRNKKRQKPTPERRPTP